MNTPIEEIYKLAEQKMNQLGFKAYNFKHRTLVIPANSIKEFYSIDQYWYLKSTVFGVTISSDYGFSGDQIPATNEVGIEHTGSVEIKNNTNRTVQISFVQVLPLN